MADELIAQHVISPSGDCQCTLNDNIWLPGHNKGTTVYMKEIVLFVSAQ